MRRLVYNLVITGLSVSVALLVAGIGLAGMIAGRDEANESWLSRALADVDIDMNTLGCVVVFVFATAWLVAAVTGRLGRPQRRSAWIRPSAPKMTLVEIAGKSRR